MPATFQAPSRAVLTARANRLAAAHEKRMRIEWYVKNVMDTVDYHVEDRIRIATEFLRAKIVSNISRSVTIGVGPRGGRVVVNRSTPGQYPRADTTQLMKTIFGGVRRDANGNWTGYVGTPLDYGLILEVRMGRPFLTRTLQEEQHRITGILTQRIA